MPKKRVLLTKKEIAKVLAHHGEWTTNSKETQFSRVFTFSEHVAALVFIARTTVHAEVLQHHPDITFTYKKVKVVITTHELKALTKVDVALLERISALSA